jgi:hypothetical protein
MSLPRFSVLARKILREVKTPGRIKDSRRYVAVGPWSFPQNESETGQIISVQDFKRKLEQNIQGDRAMDIGGWIVPFTYRAIITAFGYLFSQPAQASEFISLVQDYNQARFVYKNQITAIRNLQSDLDRLRSDDSDRAQELKLKIRKIEGELPEQLKDLKDLIPVVIDEVRRLISEIEDFLRAEVKDTSIPVGMTKDEYIKKIFNGEKHLAAYNQFIKAYSQEGDKDPLPLITHLFKTAKVKAKQSRTIGDPQALAAEILKSIQGNVLQFSRTSTAQVKERSPVFATAMKLIKRGQYDQAKSIIEPINLELADMIENLKQGSVTEADVIKKIMSMK